jgi:predicted nucleic acid-binding protein
MLYLDSSAIVKLVVPEPETPALMEALRLDPEAVSSVLARVEVLRAVRRTGARRALTDRAEAVLRRTALVRMSDDIVHTASRLAPPELRTLDAIHLATALSLGASVTAVVIYDGRLASAATAVGLPVRAPR